MSSVDKLHCHLISGDGDLMPDAELTDFLRCISSINESERDGVLQRIGANYHVVAVFGGQSSGKSTLLNHLFKTQFQTLDESVRRGQTTKGAFLAPATIETQDEAPVLADESANYPLLVVDFEGTDGLERGDDQNFERQLSLLALSFSDVLLINMWAVDVGRFNAANLTLLRTIFEVNLQLFSHDCYESEEKPTLVILLRDFTEKDPKPYMDTLRKSFDTIWSSIHKPEKYTNSSIDDFFVLRYFFFPHYRLQREEFDASVVSLRNWFASKSSKDYLFHRGVMFRGIPIEGLPAYLSSCWNAIRKSKDLDIPTQREILSQHRCREVQEEEFKAFQTFCLSLSTNPSKSLHEGLAEVSLRLNTEVKARVSSFYSQTKLYSDVAIKENARILEEHLLKSALEIVDLYASEVALVVLRQLDAMVHQTVEVCTRHLLETAKKIPFVAQSIEPSDVFADARSTENKRTKNFSMNSVECNKAVRNFWSMLSHKLSSFETRLLADPPSKLAFNKYTDLVANDSVLRIRTINKVVELIVQKVRSRLISMAENASETIYRGFDAALMKKEDGSARHFSTHKEVEEAVPSAIQAGLTLLGCLIHFRIKIEQSPKVEGNSGDSTDYLSRMKPRSMCIKCINSPSSNDFFLEYASVHRAPLYPDDSKVISAKIAADDTAENLDHIYAEDVFLSGPATQQAFELFKQKCDFSVEQLLRSIDSKQPFLPAWVLLALVVLGFDEMMYVVRSPILLLFTVGTIFIFFWTYLVNLFNAYVDLLPPGVALALRHAQLFVKEWIEKISPAVENAPQTVNSESRGSTDFNKPTIQRPTHVDPFENKKISKKED